MVVVRRPCCRTGPHGWLQPHAAVRDRNLVTRLQQVGMLYLSFGEAMGGRPRDPVLRCDGAVDYEAMAKRPAYVRRTRAA
jgi:hypothetical protein